jgi:hypothetical protein
MKTTQTNPTNEPAENATRSIISITTVTRTNQYGDTIIDLFALMSDSTYWQGVPGSASWTQLPTPSLTINP